MQYDAPQGNTIVQGFDGGSEPPADQLDLDQARKRAAEAAERATFHRVETERWERIGRSAAACIVQLESVPPIAQTTADSFLSDIGATQMQAQSQPRVG